MSSRLPASVDDIDVRALMAALVRRARLLLSATLLVGVMTFGIFCLITPKFAAQVQIEIVSKG